MDLDALRRERSRLAHRKRRIIYNNDGDDLWTAKQAGMSVSEFLAQRCTGVEGTQVDVLSFCNINNGDFAMTSHPSKVAATLDVTTREVLPKSQQVPGAMDSTVWKIIPPPIPPDHPALLIEGKTGFHHIIDFCRRHDIEVWASARMNDTHAQWQRKYRTPFKADHPDRWIAGPPDLGGGLEEALFLVHEGALEHPDRWITARSHGCYYSADYSRDDVRDLMFEMLREVCEAYDLDGIELDFLRGPYFFRALAQGKADVGQPNRDKVTALMRRIRAMTEEIGAKRSRPILVAMRLPDDPVYAASLGFDTTRWLSEGLLDVLIAGESSRIRPWKETVALAHQYDVPFYAAVIEIGGSTEVIRGRAIAALAAGADGIYTFNNFDPSSCLWKEIGALDTLRRVDRATCVENANVVRLMDHLARFPAIRTHLVRPPRLPLPLPVGAHRTFEFTAGEDGSRLASSPTPHVTLRLRFLDLEDGDSLSVSLNARHLLEKDSVRNAPDPGWISYRFDPSILKPGDNLLALKLLARDPRVELESVGESDPRKPSLTPQASRLTPSPLALIDLALVVTSSPQSLVPSSIPHSAFRVPHSHAAFLLTDTDILPPAGRLSSQRQWLLDELNFARPRVPGVRIFLEKHDYGYPADPVTKPLPGWHSLAILFNADELPVDTCVKDILASVLSRLDPRALAGEAVVYAGFIAGSHSLAAVALRTRSADDISAVMDRFGPDRRFPGLLPHSSRFIRATSDGHLIPRAFALLERGTFRAGVFTPS
ncbi:MAG: hypothetical protein V2A58_11585 [Planctomycetota bacterium]